MPRLSSSARQLEATQIYAFAIDAAAASLNLVAQQVSGPMFAPGQVKKALKQGTLPNLVSSPVPAVHTARPAA